MNCIWRIIAEDKTTGNFSVSLETEPREILETMKKWNEWGVQNRKG